MDVEYCCNSKKNYALEERFWDERAEEYNKKDIQKKEKSDFSDILDFIELGQDRKLKNVLDIGCGTGFYSIQFSEISEHVTGTDISENMLDYAEKNSKEKNRRNITFVKKIWSELNLEEFKWKENFDLVFASMTPAIDSHEDLMKMINCGRNLFFLSGFAERKDSIKDEISKVILGYDNRNLRRNKVYRIFNLLWDMGYYPKINYKDSNWIRSKSVDKFYEEFLIYFGGKKSLTEEDKVVIKNYLEREAVGGMVQEKTTSKVAWLYWKKYQ